MDAYAGEVQAMHPFYAYDSPARANDMDLATTNAYALPGNITAGIQHGSWSMPVKKGRAPEPSLLNSNSQDVMEDLKYSKEDIKHIENWTKRNFLFLRKFLCMLT
jgi:alcohol oxidase